MSSARTSEIALTTFPSPSHNHSDSEWNPGEPPASTGHSTQQHEFSLPPVDKGRDAWLCLAGCFFIEALVWGFPFSFGVFQQYYSTHLPFSSEPNGIAIVGTSATGLMYLSAPFVFTLMQRYPQYRRHMNIAGMPVAVTALIASSFATRTWHLILTQGILYGVGGMLFYTPTIVFLEEWFVRYRGLAFGVMWAGTGFAGVTIPFFLAAALEKWGWQTALRIWACAFTALSAPLLWFVRPRVPVARSTIGGRRKMDLKFLKSPVFLVPEIASAVQGLGYFIPSLYLPSYASDLGFDPIVGTLSVALMNAASVAGTIIVGYLIDRLHVTTVVGLVTVPTLVAVFVFWGLGVSVPTLIIFSILYGVAAGGFSTSWTGVVQEVQAKEPGGDTGIIFGFLAAARGIGAVASGPLSEAILSQDHWKGTAGWAYGTGYGSLIVFTGCTAAVGGMSCVARRIGWI